MDYFAGSHPRHRRGTDRVPPGLQHRPPHDRREAARPPRSTTRRSPAFTAVIQMGAILAVIVYFAKDIWRIVRGVVPSGSSSRSSAARSTTGWAGTSSSARSRSASSASLAKDVIKDDAALAVGGRRRADPVERGDGVRRARRPRRTAAERDLTLRDALVVGPGAVHRADPGRLALRRDDLGRPAARARPGHRDPAVASSCRSRRCSAAGLFELKDALGGDIGLGPTVVGTVGQLRGGLRLDRLAAEVRGRPLDRQVRALPRRRSACCCSSLLGTGVMTAT